jgi:hypothetical protein
MAARSGHATIVRRLIDCGANVDAASKVVANSCRVGRRVIVFDALRTSQSSLMLLLILRDFRLESLNTDWISAYLVL